MNWTVGNTNSDKCRSLLPYRIARWPVWLNGRAFARDPKRCGLKSRPVRFQVTALGKLCSHACASVTKQYNLVPADGRWRSSAGKVTAGLAESYGSLPPGGWLQVTCGLTACTPGSAPGPTIGNEYGRALPFKYCKPINDANCGFRYSILCLKTIITYHFSGRGKAIGLVRVSTCLYVRPSGQ